MYLKNTDIEIHRNFKKHFRETDKFTNMNTYASKMYLDQQTILIFHI